ncbi:MAG: Gfo/Idh/MocA family oxidoreductase [candidate division WS1 bacterium]|nr:Gfo/Idh/MocA family oxidoreductase [candidate division WS1 bacterium]
MLKVGVVGLRRGSVFVEIFSRMPECQVTAVCDLRADLAQAMAAAHPGAAAYTDYDVMVDKDLDVVVIATPVQSHVEQSVAALSRNRHVLCEVPAAGNLQDCRTLLRAARASKGKYMMAENGVFWAFVEAWREMVREGRLGKLLHAECEYIHDMRELIRGPDGQPTWRAVLPPIHYCTHSLGPVLSLTEDRCVKAVGFSTGANILPGGPIDMEVAMFQTAQGASVKLLRGLIAERRPPLHYYSIYGTRGVLETSRSPEDPVGTTLAMFRDVPNLPRMMKMPLGLTHANVAWPVAALGYGTAEIVMVRAFLRSLLDDTRPPVDIATALNMTVPGLVAHVSAERGSAPLPVPDLAAEAEAEEQAKEEAAKKK